MCIKIAGFIFVVFGFGIWGIKKAEHMQNEEEICRAVYDSMRVFKNEIEFKTPTLYDAFMKASEYDKSGVFIEGAKRIYDKGAVKSFKDAACQIEDKEISEILLCFAQGLNTSDKMGLIKNADSAIQRLFEKLGVVTENNKKYKKLYISCSFLFGTAVGIMLL